MLRRFGRLIGEDGQVYAVIPMEHYEALLDIRDEWSAELDKQGKNLHGLPQLTPEERYGEDVEARVIPELADAVKRHYPNGAIGDPRYVEE